ncbi:MAG: YggS family pyridoxal phosphate-dependent enzyme [Thermoanaerobaculia bacterium]|nr:YggS family pyridoxal phosphate-dependent enzyme [Thermoanaerobaculia bacterium]
MSGANERDVAERYQQIRRRMKVAARRAGRSEKEIVLVGASKRQPLDRMHAAWQAGLRVFGENRVQNALENQAALAERGVEAEWHYIGPLQSNKARAAAEAFSVVHSVDRPKIARALDRHAGELGKTLYGMIEVNLGEEESKYGFSPGDLAQRVAPLAELEALHLEGLMAIPPYETELEKARDWFRRLRELRDELFARPEWSGRAGWLSMGMSYDFEEAIAEGATHIRIGTALFGTRT